MIGPPPLEAFTAKERKLIQRLSTPRQVQRWLTSLPYNWERQGGTMRSFREVVRRNEAHCLEAAVAAAVLFQDHGGGNRGFQTVRFISPHHLAKRPHGSALPFPVVRQRSQPPLDLPWRAQSLNQLPLFCSEGFKRRRSDHMEGSSIDFSLCKSTNSGLLALAMVSFT